MEIKIINYFKSKDQQDIKTSLNNKIIQIIKQQNK